MLAAGKAAGSMTEIAERITSTAALAADRIAGIAVTRHGYGRPTAVIEMIEAGHPVPDEAGLDAAARTLAACRRRDGRRSRAGADFGRRLGELDRAGRTA